MEDLIKRSDAKQAIYELLLYLGEEDINTVVETVMKEIPSADRPVGYWKNADGNFVPLDNHGITTDSCWCSECGEWLVASDEYPTIGKFCPNCGADMREREGE